MFKEIAVYATVFFVGFILGQYVSSDELKTRLSAVEVLMKRIVTALYGHIADLNEIIEHIGKNADKETQKYILKRIEDSTEKLKKQISN